MFRLYFSQEILNNVKAGVFKTQTTNHLSLKMSLSKYITFKQEYTVYRKINYQVSSDLIKNQKWKNGHSTTNINGYIDIFMITF